MNIFYTYGYLDPDTCGPKYYGKGYDATPWGGEDRKFHHLTLAQLPNLDAQKYRYNPHLINWIRVLLREGKTPRIIIVQDDLSEKEALELEHSMITKTGRWDQKKGPLYNLTDGGEGASGLIVTAEMRELISAKVKAARALESPEAKAERYRKISEEHKQFYASLEGQARLEARRGIPSGMLGKQHTDDAKSRIRKGNLGRTFSEDHKAKIAASVAADHATARAQGIVKGNVKRHLLTELATSRQVETYGNLKITCAELGLDYLGMYRVLRGATKQHRGWTIARLEEQVAA